LGKPAARLGDMTAHGGTIVVGCPTVLIGGMPAARLGDMHVCPLLNPGLPPPPHVGGPVMLGSAGVLIGGMPAARMGDMVTCSGPPDTIMAGCPTVLIGEMGSGSASGGGGGAPGTAAVQASAATAQMDNAETSTKIEHWVEFEFVDKAGNPVSNVPYKFTDPDSNDSEAVLRLDGKVRRDGISEGQCEVILFGISNAKWDKEEAEVGEKVKLSAETEGFEDDTPATIEIYKQDIKGPDVVFDTIETEVKGDKIETEWEYVYPEEEDEGESTNETQSGYSAPQYYFEVIVKNLIAHSGLLDYKDWIEIELRDEENNPIANEDYLLYLPTGEIRKGKLNKDGYMKEEKIPSGYSKIVFPNQIVEGEDELETEDDEIQEDFFDEEEIIDEDKNELELVESDEEFEDENIVEISDYIDQEEYIEEDKFNEEIEIDN